MCIIKNVLNIIHLTDFLLKYFSSYLQNCPLLCPGPTKNTVFRDYFQFNVNSIIHRSSTKRAPPTHQRGLPTKSASSPLYSSSSRRSWCVVPATKKKHYNANVGLVGAAILM